MFFSISTLLYLTTAVHLVSAAPTRLPTLEKRRSVVIPPLQVTKVYEWSPNQVFPSDGWGETSRVGTGNSGVRTLIAFQSNSQDAGRTCNLRFAEPTVLAGTKTFTLFTFVPTNGVTFDKTKTSWNSRTGYADRELATYKHETGSLPGIVYSFSCPDGNKILNYELAPVGESNMQWNTPNGEGLYLEVVEPVTVPNPPSGAPIPIPMADQVQLSEATPDQGTGSMQFGEVSSSKVGLQIVTLIGYIMPATSYTGRTCRVRFQNPTTATGSKSIAVFEYVPSEGKIFKSDRVKWNSRGGFRNRELAVTTVGDNARSIYEFPCKAPGEGVNFELVPRLGEMQVKWDTSATPKGGLILEVL